jgi:hypothetical protein
MSPDPQSSRRRFLEAAGAVGLSATSGCLGIVETQLAKRRRKLREVSWPPEKPDTVPSLDELPELAVPTQGKSDAVSVEVFQDFGTMMSGEFFHEELPSLQYDISVSNVAISYRDNTIPVSDWSYPIAIAARSVQAQLGERGFWAFAKRVNPNYRPYPSYSKERVLSAAEAVGASSEQVKEDVESWKYYATIQREKRYAAQYDFAGVPTAVIDEGEDKSTMSGFSAGNLISRIERTRGPIEEPDSNDPEFK